MSPYHRNNVNGNMSASTTMNDCPGLVVVAAAALETERLAVPLIVLVVACVTASDTELCTYQTIQCALQPLRPLCASSTVCSRSNAAV